MVCVTPTRRPCIGRVASSCNQHKAPRSSEATISLRPMDHRGGWCWARSRCRGRGCRTVKGDDHPCRGRAAGKYRGHKPGGRARGNSKAWVRDATRRKIPAFSGVVSTSDFSCTITQFLPTTPLLHGSSSPYTPLPAHSPSSPCSFSFCCPPPALVPPHLAVDQTGPGKIC
jgi:hypothetical protein